MAFGFNIAFAEPVCTVDGVSAVHLVPHANEAASARTKYHFVLTVSTTSGRFSQTLEADMPDGATDLRVPFVPPLAWAEDCCENIGDLAYPDACGSLWVTMRVEYTGYGGSLRFENTFTGYTAYCAARVDESLVPEITAVAIAQADEVVPAAWGCWVQGLSQARLTVEAAGTYGSSIVAYRYGDGIDRVENSRVVRLTESGAVTIPVTVLDSRNRIATRDVLLTVQPYAPPALTGITTRRCTAAGVLSEEGTCFQPAFTAVCSPVGGRNQAAVRVRWKRVTETAFGPETTLNAAAPALVAANLEPGASYDVAYTVQDGIYTIHYRDYISSTGYLLHFRKGGTGIAVGKAAEQDDLFDVALPATLRRNVTVGGDLAVTGALTLSGANVGGALTRLGQFNEAAAQVNAACFSEVTENRVVRCGNLVMLRLCGQLGEGEELPWQGEVYRVAQLPAGYFSATYPVLAVATQNSLPCRAAVNAEGAVFVIPAEDGATDTIVTAIGFVEPEA